MLRYLYLIVFFIGMQAGVAFCAKPVKEVKKPLVAQHDSVDINKRIFNQPALEKYRHQKEFQYDEGYVGESFWDRLERWFWSLFDNTNKSLVARGITYLLMALGVVGIVFLIMKLAGVDPFKVIRGKAASAGLPYSELTENIHEINMDDELEKAINVRNYRLAVRLLYLKSLKQLNDAGLIRWEINKTNSQYSNELRDFDQRLAFNLLTRQFEYIWYGEFNIDADAFGRINNLFTDFKVKR
ncbi:DUF4129 domain-containing protein [Mucilaginibacter calamicampi]|uniref:DUF4129 domain-containing protein n=1 Tax=Mucilaginibacter calamicampi TaxID=1302352 RepID=A0ABW2YY36_9SPHI